MTLVRRLREAKGPGVDYPIRPGESELRKSVGQVGHSPSAVQMQHERDVLDEDSQVGDRRRSTKRTPRRLGPTRRPRQRLQFFQLARGPGTGSRQRRGPLWGDSCKHLDICNQRHAREARRKHTLGGSVQLAEQFRAPTSPLKSEFDATDSSEESGGPHGAESAIGSRNCCTAIYYRFVVCDVEVITGAVLCRLVRRYFRRLGGNCSRCFLIALTMMRFTEISRSWATAWSCRWRDSGILTAVGIRFSS